MITKKNPIAITVDVAATGAIRSIKKLTGALGGIGLGAGAAVAGITVLGGAMGVATAAAMRHAAKLELIQNKTSIVFGDQLPIIKRWSEETAASFGLTAINLEGMAAGFQDLLIPMGFARDEAAQMTMDVVGLAGAMSEWSAGTRSVEDTTRILARAMLGEREMLKDLGVDIRELDIKQRLMAKGQEDLTGNFLKQARAVATMEMIFERSKDAQAGFAKGGDSLTRTIREMSSRFQEMIQQMQLELTPSFKLLVDKITDEVIPKIEGELFPVIGDLIEGFAEKLPGAIDATLEMMEEWGPSVGRAAEAAFDLATHLDDLFMVIKENQGHVSTLLLIAGTLGIFFGGPLLASVVAVAAGFKLAFIEAERLTEKNKGLADGTKHLADELDAMIEEQDRLNVAYERAIQPAVEVTESFDQMAAASEDYERQVIKAKASVDAMTVSFKGINQQQIATAIATDILARQQAGQIEGFDQMNAEIQRGAILLKHYSREQRELEGLIGTIQTVAGLAPLGRPADEPMGAPQLSELGAAAAGVQGVARGNTEVGRFGFNLTPGVGLLGSGGPSLGGTANNVFQAFRMAQEKMGFAMDSQRARNVAQTLGHQLHQQMGDGQIDLRTDHQRLMDIAGVDPGVTDKSVKIFLNVNELADPIAIGDKIMEILQANPNYMAGEIFGGRAI